MIFRDIASRLNAELRRLPDVISLRLKPNSTRPVVKGKTSSRKPRGPVIISDIHSHQKRTTRRLGYLFIVAFSIFFFISIISLVHKGSLFEQTIKEEVRDGLEKIVSAASLLKSGSFSDARIKFQEAHTMFESIDEHAWFAQISNNNSLTSDSTLKSMSAIITIGKELSISGEKGIDLSQQLQSFFRSFLAQSNISNAANRQSISHPLLNTQPLLTSIAESLKRAQKASQEIDSSLVPKELTEEFTFAKNALNSATTAFSNIDTHLPALAQLLGDTAPHTYFILLQNSGELRPTGGFIGNVMIVELNDGYITKSEIHDVYEFDHQLTERIAPPSEIKHVSEFWYLRDSNFSPDFPTSAQMAARFLEKENGPGVDTVIAINENVLRDLLLIIGSVQPPELTAAITAENVYPVLSYVVESKALGREDPKQIVRWIAQAIGKKLVSENAKDISLQLAVLAAKEIAEKNIIMYSNDSAVQNFIQDLNADGRLEKNDDYLAISHTSIGGNKSDVFVSEEVNHTTYIQADGSIIDELTIQRHHGWDWDAYHKLEAFIKPFGIKEISPAVLPILGMSPNKHMLRIYVPEGSKLVSSSGSPVSTQHDDELHATYFSTRMAMEPGSNSSVTLKYKIPHALKLTPIDQYKLTLNKQAGQSNVVIRKRIIAGLDMAISPGNNDVWELNQPWEHDMNVAVTIVK